MVFAEIYMEERLNCSSSCLHHIFLKGLTLITCSTCTYNSVFSFGLCLPVRGRLSPNTQIMICRLVNTGVVVVVPDRMSCFGRTILISAESRIFLPKYSYFCRNMTISAFLPNPIFEPESLFRQANQKNIRPNYSAESLLGRTLVHSLLPIN